MRLASKPPTTIIRAVPFTLTLVVLVIVASILIATGVPSNRSDLIAYYGFSLRNMRAEHPWVVLTMLLPWEVTTVHIVATFNFLVILGTIEWLLGTHRTAMIFLLGHVVTLLLTTLVLSLVVQSARSSAAQALLYATDTGTSVGVMCCVGAVVARRRLWPLALLIGVGLTAWAAYTLILYNIEHAIALAVGWLMQRTTAHRDHA
jgi:uncharacterized protein YejL (UPF0352 family)